MEEAEIARRKALQTAAAALCVEAGYISTEKDALGVLSEIMQSYITELGRTARVYSELASRTEPTASDVQMALVDSGMDIKALPVYAKRPQRRHLPRQLRNYTQPQPKTLQVGTKIQRPSNVPTHLPSFPDPHTYIRTPVYRPPASDYKTVREKTAVQKRSSKKSLSSLLAKTRTSRPVSGEADPYGVYTVVTTPTPTAPHYLQALMPGSEDQLNTTASDKTSNDEPTSIGIDQSELSEGDLNEPMDTNDGGSGQSSSMVVTAETYENPFLKPAKRIKLKYTGL